ncbi:UNKNOWN [Stylonychia lemnae]|uniref:Uncharacterized protein n=1 Tax=Stylonychia lemnae TaxID=5949 RepID=A0A078B0W6_STYLE|nr:UNKNOWN [Stylonychia lemnae]|eukprot:CDW86743.1 UNKNOWN [Stylonychia lemnae]
MSPEDFGGITSLNKFYQMNAIENSFNEGKYFQYVQAHDFGKTEMVLDLNTYLIGGAMLEEQFTTSPLIDIAIADSIDFTKIGNGTDGPCGMNAFSLSSWNQPRPDIQSDYLTLTSTSNTNVLRQYSEIKVYAKIFHSRKKINKEAFM